MSETAHKRILIVDDEADLVDMVRRKLERHGFAVEVAYNGEEAMSKVAVQDFDLILTDVVMPVMDGFTLYKNLKDNPDTARIPVIILTARSNMEGSFRALGADDFLTKPFDGADLLSKIEDFLKKNRAPAHRARIYVTGTQSGVLREMSQILDDFGCRTRVIGDPFALFKICYEEPPEVILMDVILEGVKSSEIIKGLRAFDRLKATKIVVYTHLDPARLPSHVTAADLQEAKDACMCVGATRDIGPYTMVTFMDSLREYLL